MANTIQAADKRTGVVRSTRFSLIGKETEYGVTLDNGTEVIFPASQVEHIIQHAHHEYWPASAHRGHCKRCDGPKANHQ